MQLDAGQGSALSGVGLLWRQSGCGSATKERKNNRGNGGEMQLAGLNPAIFVVVFSRLSEMVTACHGWSSLSVRVITPRLRCVFRWALIAWWILHPPSVCCVRPIWPTAWFNITHSDWLLSPVMQLMAEVYNAYVVGRVLHTCRQGCVFPALHIAESTILDIHLSNVERLHYSNMCCSSLNNAATTTFTGNKSSHFFRMHVRWLYFVLLVRQSSISYTTFTRLFNSFTWCSKPLWFGFPQFWNIRKTVELRSPLLC